MIYRRLFIFLMLAMTLMGQNFQVHYEASAQREYVVTTLEMFKPDAYGSTFWFVDMEYDLPNSKGMSLAYWEIARYFNLPVNNLSLTLQYNDGAATFGPLGQVWLAGINYYLNIGGVGLPVDILYRASTGANSPDFQFTTTWLVPFLDGHLEFAGFLDIWSQDSGVDTKDIVVLAEPQLWYTINEQVAVGTEIEMSKNFIFGSDGIQTLPTLAFRWNF
ncbi:MAG: DUF5020 family protein [Candidatus Marinimicrobia bacterium]|nr:DUF5020 family protein [Candidatus Neomarinimicrobiota bacterium]MCF7851328.1 DUF5020 family protein [Candidatus Neomarinimicrobiota bacterium]MCF7904319.1 DUF5020 family protein [Candidatus Neomarinimicrobiota bacterium]